MDRVVGSVPEVDNFKGNTEIVEPSVGMRFYSTEEIKSFYQKYANVMGFGWKIRNSKKGDDGELNYLMLACTREGSRLSKVPATLKTLPTRGLTTDATDMEVLDNFFDLIVCWD